MLNQNQEKLNLMNMFLLDIKDTSDNMKDI